MNSTTEYYLRPQVQKEICNFCKDRWVALHYLDTSYNLIFRRYLKGKPLRINDPEDLRNLINLKSYQIRSIYATANVYKSIGRFEDVYDILNVQRCTPTWDIDGTLPNWRETIAIAKEIVSFLSSRGLEKSIFVKWSGNGCHVHINEKAFSDDLLKKRHPIDLAYAVVEYVNTKLSSSFLEISAKGETTVENKMDTTRVFTSPLSLHREQNIACICIKPNQLDEFAPEWADPQNFRHDTSWREFTEGEADELAEVAYQTIGGYPIQSKVKRRKTKPLDKQIMTWLQKE